jgi:molybdate transport system substrate-binding protein
VLSSPLIKQIAIATPELAPYGRAAKEALKNSALYDQVSSKLVLGENVSQSAMYVSTHAAQIGILALSLADSPTMKKLGRYVKIDESLYSPLVQSAVILKSSAHVEEAQRFLDYLTGREGHLILKEYGF